tara:strand:- start:288 stop:464 length:177 start_codon:yes stop_codon:yes gene_type:complete
MKQLPPLTEFEKIAVKINQAVYDVIAPHLDGKFGNELLELQLDIVRTVSAAAYREANQ